MSGELISLEKVTRTYPRQKVTALRGVSFVIKHTDYAAITGPSGSGKSTLLYLAGGMDQPNEGQVFFEGKEPKTPAAWTKLRATRIGFVFQSFQLVAGLTAAQNVELPMFGVESNESARLKRADMLLERVGLGHRGSHRISELSGGESQRVAIARALANSPCVILADEPTGNLDSHNAEGVLELLEDLHHREKIALVIVTHDSRVAARANRVIRLLDGQIVDSEISEPTA